MSQFFEKLRFHNWYYISGSVSDGRDLATMCGRRDTPQVVFNPMDTTQILWKSDYSWADKGFNFTYSTSACGGILSGPTQTVVSPTRSGAGDAYPAYTDCAWIMHFDEGQQIEVGVLCCIGSALEERGARKTGLAAISKSESYLLYIDRYAAGRLPCKIPVLHPQICVLGLPSKCSTAEQQMSALL
jgi:hypothetical protein